MTVCECALFFLILLFFVAIRFLPKRCMCMYDYFENIHFNYHIFKFRKDSITADCE